VRTAMLIKDLFTRDIFRSINGVVKVDQLDDSSVWQELDEFVITKELDLHFRRFFSAYTDAVKSPNDPGVAGKIGVWISGFFGSGKSHFVKVLSYLLRNRVHNYEGQSRHAVQFFEDKIADAMLFGDIKRSVSSQPDVILFNIDSKADSREGRDAILYVFLKVLNEMLGYSGDHPHIAHMERYLDGKGKLEQFHETYRKITGTEWLDERDVYEFNRDEVVKALSETLGQSRDTAEKWIDNAENNFSLTVENFCKWVKDYLDTKGSNHRLLFLIDEVGQFIGTDSGLMLKLQTITEDLGTVCRGRAWVVVTSQEDIDAVLGEMKKTKANDFSKIQGRFKTRLSLSSANVDEVIQSRLLNKADDVKGELEALYVQKGDILKHQLTFSNVGMTLKPYRDADDFVKNYPFAPYQFQLIQKIFEAIRKAGATGLHLSRGERSILDAFQSAAQTVALAQVGVLVPLYEFYPSIESFLDTAVKRTIDQAGTNTSLEPFDIELLQALFLIRYVEEVKGNVDNLVTLCIDRIDCDRLALRRQIEASLQRLEKETLISRSGDIYFFLTNEERDVNQEIKNVILNSGEESRLLGEILYDDVLKGVRKHRYGANGMDFTFNRLCDGYPHGNRVDGALVVSVTSPLHDEYEHFKADGKCVMDSSLEHGQVLMRLVDEESLGRELRTYKKTESYLKTKNDGTLPETTKRILRDAAEDNRQRRQRVTTLLKRLVVEASYFVAGQPLTIKSQVPSDSIEQALEYLIANTYTKMSYIKVRNPTPEKEIQAILRANDIGQQTLKLTIDEGNPEAIAELRNYIDLCTKTSKQIVLHDLIEVRFYNRPYGWPDMEVALLLARLSVLGEISMVIDGGVIPHDKCYDALTTPAKWRKIVVTQRRTPKPEELKKARLLGQDVFSQMGPEGEDALFTFLKGKLQVWQTALLSFKPLAETGDYPGLEEVKSGLTLTKKLLADEDSFKFIERFNVNKDELKDLSNDFHDLEHFYEHQKPTWDALRKANGRFQPNRSELEHDATAAPAWKRMGEILKAPAPFGMLHEVDALINTVKAVNSALVAARRKEALEKIDGFLTIVGQELDVISAEAALKASCTGPLQTLRSRVAAEESLAHITQAKQDAQHTYDTAVTKIEEASKSPKPVMASDGAGKRTPSAVTAVKPRRVIEPAKLVQSVYLETKADVDGFLETLRTELERAIANKERIEIR
jgi:hypothetical protein